MITTLCFDFGNTRLKCGVFEGDIFKEEIILGDAGVDTIEKLIMQYQPQKTILSSAPF